MPNHVTSVCTITGPTPDVAAFVERHIVRDDEGRSGFDLNSVIPKPSCFEGSESGSTTEVGLFALYGIKPSRRFFPLPDTDDPSQIWRYLPRHVTTREKLLAYLGEKDPKTLAAGRIAKRCNDETGYYDWYEWSVANWGTKWNAYEFEERARGDGTYVFRFETAWSFPEPVFRRLAEMYPALVFDVASFDEGWNFGCRGQFNGKDDYRCSKELATRELHVEVYGYPPPNEEDS